MNKKELSNYNDVLKQKESEIEELKNKLNTIQTELNNTKGIMQGLIKNAIEEVINITVENILAEKEKNKLSSSQKAKKKYYEKIKKMKQVEN